MSKLFDCSKCVSRIRGETDSDVDDKDCDCCDGARIGDILCIDGEYRATCAYIMGPNGWESLSKLGPGQGSGGVPLRISKHIDDPIAFFGSDVMEAGDIYEVEMDPEVHCEALKRLTGGREVHKSLKVRLDYEGDCILTTVPCVNGESREISLDRSIDSVYLTGEPLTSPDPLMIKENEELLKKYNEDFEKNTEPGCRVLYSLETENSHHGGSLIIKSRETDADGNIVRIVCEDKYNLGLANVKKTLWTFVPERSPYLSVPVWSCHEFDNPYWGKAESFTLNWEYSHLHHYVSDHLVIL